MVDNGRIRAMYETWHEAWGRGQYAYDTSVLAGYVGQLLDDAAAAEARIAELTAERDRLREYVTRRRDETAR